MRLDRKHLFELAKYFEDAPVGDPLGPDSGKVTLQLSQWAVKDLVVLLRALAVVGQAVRDG